MNMGGRSFGDDIDGNKTVCSEGLDLWQYPGAILNGVHDQLQMLDRVVRRVYPDCYKSYQCQLISHFENNYWPS